MVRIFEVDGGYGYEVDNGVIKVRQEQLPAISGIQRMTKRQAQALAEMVAQKLQERPGELPTLTVDEVTPTLSLRGDEIPSPLGGEGQGEGDEKKRGETPERI